MTFLSWCTDYEVGVAQIDREHHGLFDLINEYHEAHSGGACDREIALVLNRLVAYAEEHFQHEEALMSASAYPLLEAHRELHGKLAQTVFAINERLAVDAARAGAEILPFVKNWLVEHIVRNDMDVADFLRRESDHAAPLDAASEERGDVAAALAAAELAAS